MTREYFINKMLENDGGNSPPQQQEIDVDKIVDTIALRLENKLNNELEKIQKANEKILNEKGEKNNEDYQNKQGIEQEGNLQSDNESADHTN